MDTKHRDQFRFFLKDSIRKRIDFSETDQNRGVAPPPIEKPFPPDAMRIDLAKFGKWQDIPAIDLTKAIRNRKSRRVYSREAMNLDELSYLLWATQGIRTRMDEGHALRTVPSAGCPVYGWLAAQPGTDPILELPVSGRRNEGPVDLQRQMYLLYHGKPRFDGASGFISNRYAAFRRDMQAFPAPEAIALAYNMGARRLIVHYADYTPARREAIRHQVNDAADLREVAAFGEDVVYQIRGGGAPSSDLPAHRR